MKAAQHTTYNKPSIDTVYPFEEVNIALDKVANGRSKGKTVLIFD